MMGYKALWLAGFLAAGAVLAGCNDSSDNLDDSTFSPFIDTAAISEEANTPAALTVADGLDYQVALVYELAVNWRGYDAVDKTPVAEASVDDCALGGTIIQEHFDSGAESPYAEGDLPFSRVETVHCVRELEAGPPVVNYYTDGLLAYGEAETEDCDDGPCPVAYGSFGGALYPYRLKYSNPADEPDRTHERLEIDGTYHDGPGDSIDGGTSPVTEQTQRLTIVNSVKTIVADEVTDKTVFGLVYGEPGERFTRRDVTGADELFLDGALASGSDGGAECVGGAFTVTTNTRMEHDGSDNVIAGEVELDNGDGETATLEFQPTTGDVFVTDSGGDTETYTRGEIQTLRDTCFQTVAVHR